MLKKQKQTTLTGFVSSSPAVGRVFKHIEDSDEEEKQEEEYPEDRTPKRMMPKSTMDHGARVKTPMDLTHLPPINDLNEMFSDLINQQPLEDLKTLLDRLDGRPLRVATMCSGTESPLLALSILQPLIREKFGRPLEVEHVFSCEIEPFKQAYIERNFSPPILFRDVCELGNDEATTAYGAKVKVPGDVDILIAGTSCVDFSNLNNNKQQIDGEGESGATFRGMLSWVGRHRPTVVILENVLSAPWEKSVCPHFRRVGYAAEWCKLDTKNYYIPHTRQRGYMCAIDSRCEKGKSSKMELGVKKSKSGPDQWKSMLKVLERPASSPIEAFLLPEDDPRIVRTRASMIDFIRNASTIDWARCEVRHRNARFAEEIGDKRPLTLWNEGGGCALPDFAWNDWAVTQPERVLDLMDISVLRYAVKGMDASYKTIVWNLSQNVDRIGYPKGGLSPCMTPTMIPYISNRGGPLTGYEALGMQGLPVDRLLLTRESEDNCMDLAGNAMSTTVVGSAVLSALVVAASKLKRYNGQNTAAIQSTHIPQSMAKFDGQDKLNAQTIDLGSVVPVPASQLLQHAQQSRRLCDCEGRTAMTSRKIVQCKDCGFTACSKCYGRPEHNYQRTADGGIDLDHFKLVRLDPRSFEKEFKAAVPMRLSFQAHAATLIENFEEDRRSMNIEDSRWLAWKDALSKAFSAELRFRNLKRQEIWTARWESDFAYLELVLDPRQPEWRLFAKPAKSIEAGSEIRRLLNQPVARLSFSVDDSKPLLAGTWQLCLPSRDIFDITLYGGNPGTGSVDNGLDDFGDLTPSWEMSLGLLAKEFRSKRVWKYLDVIVPEQARTSLDIGISGRYYLRDKCGCASNSLHKHEDKDLFLFLDPQRCTTAEADSFIFSVSQRRYAYGEIRPVVAYLDPKFRQFGQATNAGPILKEVSAKCFADGKWLPINALVLQAAHKQKAQIQVMTENCPVRIGTVSDDCLDTSTLLVCKLPLDCPEVVWTDSWTEVDPVHERQTFDAISWLTERLKGIENLDEWMMLPTLNDTKEETICNRCAPPPPQVFFGDVLVYSKAKNSAPRLKIVGVEDIGEAGKFERALKNRPQSFVTQLRLINGVAELRIGLNIASMLHQALARLTRGPEAAQSSWRLDTGYIEKHRLILSSFKKALEQSSNRGEKEAKQPPHFKIPLRTEQLRSLTWMLRQESIDAKLFTEQEIVEALLTPLGWRAEARVTRKTNVLGGVLADEVGYGKTAITLGLIDSASAGRSEPQDEYGFISLKATLIVVPAHLIKQWPSEVYKFLGTRTRCITIENAGQLKKLSLRELQSADIVCVAGNLLKSKAYLAVLGALAGGVKVPDAGNGGRYFDQMYEQAVNGLKRTVEDLKTGKVSQAWSDVRYGRAEDLATRKRAFVQRKRMKGRAFREARALDAKKVIPPSTCLKEPSQTVRVSPAQPASSRERKRKRKRSVRLLSDTDTSSEEDIAYLSSEGEEYAPRSRLRSKHFDVVIRTDTSVKKVAGWKRIRVTRSPESSTTHTLEDDSMDADHNKAIVDDTTKQAAHDSDSDDVDHVTSETDILKGMEIERGEEMNNAIKNDAWGFGTTRTQSDYLRMKSPVLEMFKFNRLVIDEYTYLTGKLHKMTMNMRADRRWILSGTPPIDDFAAIKTISVFLGIELGINDIPPNVSAQRHWFNGFTAVEKFHSFRETRSFAWHTTRHQQADKFLKQFMRQNKAEIDEIPSKEVHHNVVLPAAERAIYLELLHHLQAIDMNIKRGKKGASDREKRIAESFGESQTAEEALLKRCSHFDYGDHDAEDHAIYECDRLVMKRTQQLRECEEHLHRTLWELYIEEYKDTNECKSQCANLYAEDSIFRNWLMHMRQTGTTDGDATKRVRRILDQIEDCIQKKETKHKPALSEYETDAVRRAKLRYNKPKTHLMSKHESMMDHLPPAQQKKLKQGQTMRTLDEDDETGRIESDDDISGEIVIRPQKKQRSAKVAKELIIEDGEADTSGLIARQPDWADEVKRLFKDKSHMLKRIEKELVGRVKSLRFFEVVRDVQRLNSKTISITDKPKITYICPGSNCQYRSPDGTRIPLALKDVCVFSTCGHTGCFDCLQESSFDQKCPEPNCFQPGIMNVIVRSTSLGEEEDIQNEVVAGKHWGTKIEQICDLIKNVIPKDEKIILFSQFKDLTETIDDALQDKGIQRLRIQGSATAKSKALLAFQNPASKERVLVLNVADESASGANLTVASHVIFVSPLLCETFGQYVAQETQAIGRVKRYGQKREVVIHRFLTAETIDTEIYRKREEEKAKFDADEVDDW